MARSQETQRQRNQNNPLALGSFDTTSIRYLKGTLGPANQVVGRADTNQQSNGGYGGGSYNHWYQVNLQTNAWIIVVKAGSRPKYIQTSVYDLNRHPIEGRSIFQADSVSIPNGPNTYYPYNSTAMGAQSDLYNTFDPWRLDEGDERYYPLETGAYLICVSTTRNEPLSYEVGLVVEVPKKEAFIQLEDDEPNLLVTEDAIDFTNTVNVPSIITVNTVISSVPGQPNGFSETPATINAGVTVTVLEDSTWFISTPFAGNPLDEVIFAAEPGSDAYFDSIHDHSLSEWRASWEASHQDTDKFPEAFIPYTNRA